MEVPKTQNSGAECRVQVEGTPSSGCVRAAPPTASMAMRTPCLPGPETAVTGRCAPGTPARERHREKIYDGERNGRFTAPRPGFTGAAEQVRVEIARAAALGRRHRLRGHLVYFRGDWGSCGQWRGCPEYLELRTRRASRALGKRVMRDSTPGRGPASWAPSRTRGSWKSPIGGRVVMKPRPILVYMENPHMNRK